LAPEDALPAVPYWLYNLILSGVAPAAALWLRAHPRHHPAAARFHPPAPPVPPGPLWLQACSVGEVNTVAPLVERLGESLPNLPLMITASTPTGVARARERFGEDRTTWLQPRALVLVETELWPNILRHGSRLGVPSILVNGRISDKHATRYRRWRPVFPPMFAHLSAAGVQNARYAERLAQLGVPRSRIEITGSLKFDAVPTAVPSKARARQEGRPGRWRRRNVSTLYSAMAVIVADGLTPTGPGKAAASITYRPGQPFTWPSGSVTIPMGQARARLRSEHAIPPDTPVLVLGSIRPAEEALAAQWWTQLREQFPQLRLILAPRHLERAAAITERFSEPLLKRSEVQAGRSPAGERVILVDTLGELTNFYSIASVAVVGGTFDPEVQGHNPLEPAALGVATLFGPHTANFPDAVQELLAYRGAIQLATPEAVPAEFKRLLHDAAERRQLGTRGRRAVLANQGAVEKTVRLISRVMESASSAAAP